MTLTIDNRPAGCLPFGKIRRKFAGAGIAFLEVDVTTNAAAAAFEDITEVLGFCQIFDKEDAEDHWSGLSPARIPWGVDLEVRIREGALA